ncbi:MAG: hypothetical protein LBC96_09985 [Lachnospiraceae bacterium]|jgi:DNA-binding LytR/AlgR family response regulator|nr:hypothetical protein [Lachnospiraceae bacterium]
MHIAICDDNIADRKQTERLLSRESERRKASSGVLYVRSYGRAEALLKAPMQYDLFLIDMTKSDENGLHLALTLCKRGVTAEILLLTSSIDYQKLYSQLSEPPPNLSFISKPLKIAELSQEVEAALEKRSMKTPAIELRTITDTLYLKEADIIYGVGSSNYTTVSLVDGSVITTNERLLWFFEQLCIYPSFYLVNKKTFVNIDYIDKCSLFKLSLKCGQHFLLSPLVTFDLKRLIPR